MSFELIKALTEENFRIRKELAELEECPGINKEMLNSIKELQNNITENSIKIFSVVAELD